MTHDSKMLWVSETAAPQVLGNGVEVVNHLPLMHSGSCEVHGAAPRAPRLPARAEAIAEVRWIVTDAETTVAVQDGRSWPGGLGFLVHQVIVDADAVVRSGRMKLDGIITEIQDRLGRNG